MKGDSATAIAPVAPWSDLPADQTVSHLRAETAITMGLWPFVCPYCGDKFQTENGSFPYCSPICGINAQND